MKALHNYLAPLPSVEEDPVFPFTTRAAALEWLRRRAEYDSEQSAQEAKRILDEKFGSGALIGKKDDETTDK